MKMVSSSLNLRFLEIGSKCDMCEEVSLQRQKRREDQFEETEGQFYPDLQYSLLLQGIVLSTLW